MCSAKDNIEMTNEDYMDGLDPRRSRNIHRAKRKRASNTIISDNENSNEDEENMNAFKGQSSNARSTKREKAVSDDETSYDDNTKICTLIAPNTFRYKTDTEDEADEIASKKRLTRLRTSESKIRQDKSSSKLKKTNFRHISSSSEESYGGVEMGSETWNEFRGGTSDNEICNVDEEDTNDDFSVPSLNTRSAKRKRTTKISTHEGVSKQRLTRLRKSKSKNRHNSSFESEKTTSIHEVSSSEENYDGVEVGSEIEGERDTSESSGALNVSSENEICIADEVDTDDFNGPSSNKRSAKRRRAAKISTHEGASKQRLTRLRKLKSKNRQDINSFESEKTISLHEFSSSEDTYDGVEVGRESEGESWNESIDDTSESLGELNVSNDDEICIADEEDTNDFNGPSSNTRSAKRKRDAKINTNEGASKQRLKRLRKSGYKNRQHKSSFKSEKTISLHEVSSSEENYEGVEVGIQLEGEKLNESIAVTSESLDTLSVSSENDIRIADKEDTNDFNVPSSNTRSAKRKRAANEGASKKRLTRLGKSKSKNKLEKNNFDLNISCDNDDDDNHHHHEDNDAEHEELDGDSEFIDDSSEKASDHTHRTGDSCDEPEDASNNYKGIIDMIGRKRLSNGKWDLEGSMLADFGKDPELCMRAVCALYRQQTADEKTSKETQHRNKRGFSQTDAFRGSKLAEFLTEGDSKGDLNRTVEDLELNYSNGIELCMDLAQKYSKQLFEIYQKKEDPYFLPH